MRGSQRGRSRRSHQRGRKTMSRGREGALSSVTPGTPDPASSAPLLRSPSLPTVYSLSPRFPTSVFDPFLIASSTFLSLSLSPLGAFSGPLPPLLPAQPLGSGESPGSRRPLPISRRLELARGPHAAPLARVMRSNIYLHAFQTIIY